MGQTLTHGVYLPDEGERNCYSGLAANWQILDSSVGTIAAHTAALAGKAPLVHTHTKSDITDFPSYGTTAGTICEGNDSRLSDARTPVAHTHGKADITDLFNSANTWSANQTFLTNPIIRNDIIEKGVIPAANSEKTVVFADKNNNQISSLYARINTNGESYVALRAENLYKNGAMDSTGDLVYSVVFIGMDSQGNPYCVPRADLYPDNTNRFNLGTSSKKWKSLNGVNPGALSFPKVDGWNSGTELTAAVGVDTTNWDMSGGTWNEMTNNIQDGWVFFAFQGCRTGDRAIVRYYGTNARYLTMGFNAVGSSGTGYYLYVAFPMAKGSTVNISFVTSGSVMSKFIYPCMGNV